MQQVPTSGRDVFIRYKTNAALAGPLVIPDNCSNRMAIPEREPITSKEGSRRANYPILTLGASDKKY